jgi:hypothetical protein
MADEDFRRSIDTKVHWGTQTHILDCVREVGPIDHDPCSNTSAVKRVKARTSWMLNPENGLMLPWEPQIVSYRGVCFVNPPYGIVDWYAKIASEARQGVPIIALVSASTETNWWNDYIMPWAIAVCFVRGRLKFIDCTKESDFSECPAQLDFWGNLPPALIEAGDKKKSVATFGSALVYMARDRTPRRFAKAFSKIGRIWYPNHDPYRRME